MPLIFRTEYQEECSTSYEQECSTSYETTYEQQCSTSYETVCEEAQSSYGGSSGGYGAPSAPKCSQVPKQNCQQVILFKRMVIRFSYFFIKVPKQTPKQNCQQVPKQNCQQKQVQVPDTKCSQVSHLTID